MAEVSLMGHFCKLSEMVEAAKGGGGNVCTHGLEGSHNSKVTENQLQTSKHCITARETSNIWLLKILMFQVMLDLKPLTAVWNYINTSLALIFTSQKLRH